MHVCEMREIEKVVIQQLIVAFDRKRFSLPRPTRIIEPGKSRNRGLVRFLRIAHPNPQGPPTFTNWITSNPRGRWNRFLTGDENAFSGAVVFETVVMTSDKVAVQLAERQRQPAMTTAIFERDDRPAGLP